MLTVDKRRFPRIPHVTSRQIVTLDGSQTPQKNIVVTKNLSACGIRLTTSEPISSSGYFLIYLNKIVLKELDQYKKNLLRCGDYYLSCVIWSQPVKPDLYDVGARFIEKNSTSSKEMDTFTELVNVSMLDQINLAAKLPVAPES